MPPAPVMPRSELRRPARGATRRRFRMRELTILISVILAVGVFGALNRQFLDVETVVTILENAAPDGLIVIGMCIVIICGAFDMSVGSAMAVCGLVAALAMNKAHLPVPLAMLRSEERRVGKECRSRW